MPEFIEVVVSRVKNPEPVQRLYDPARLKNSALELEQVWVRAQVVEWDTGARVFSAVICDPLHPSEAKVRVCYQRHKNDLWRLLRCE